MTKLSERVPDPKARARLRSWLKELALCFEALDQREQKESRYVRKELTRIWQNSGYIQKGIPEYEPQTYDEAIALCKGWPRAAFGYDISWERDKWPELWKEMVETKIRKLYLSEIDENWVFNLDSVIYKDSTPGRVVCQVYLIYEGHADWALRLRKIGGDCD